MSVKTFSKNRANSLIFSIDGIIIALIRNHTVFRRIKEVGGFTTMEKKTLTGKISDSDISLQISVFVANYKDGAWMKVVPQKILTSS